MSGEILDLEPTRRKRKPLLMPTLVLWGIIPFFWLLYFCSNYWSSTIDIQMHDTYFVIATLHLAIAYSIYFSILGMIYYFFRKFRLIKWMALFHIAITLLQPFAGLFYLNQNLYTYNFHLNAYSLAFFILMMSFLLVQILFVLNILIGVYRNWKDQKL